MCSGMCLTYFVALLITSRKWSAHSKQMAHREAHSEFVWVWLLFVNYLDVLKCLCVCVFLADKVEIKKNGNTPANPQMQADIGLEDQYHSPQFYRPREMWTSAKAWLSCQISEPWIKIHRFCFAFLFVLFLFITGVKKQIFSTWLQNLQKWTQKFLKEHPHIESPQLTEISEQISGGPSIFIISFTPPDKTLWDDASLCPWQKTI